jgi:N-acetyl-anhydromuramyl-L-alanine amidase AmpD
MRVLRLQTPNYKNGLVPKGVAWHHTAGTFSGSVAWCMDKSSKVSYHGIVNLNGDYTELARDNQKTWANGKSIFKGRKNCNDFLISLAVSGDTNKRLLTEYEIDSMARITIEKMELYGFGLEMVTTHREISPGRKNDIDVRSEKAIKDRIIKLIGL